DKKDEGEVEEEEEYDQNQDEKSGSKWKHDEIKSVLLNKESNAIKSKLARLTKKYKSIKKYNNQTDKERKDWYWYDKMDMIFGICENISPSVLANKET
ncbi:hypothetical protein RhiirA4_474175, partial [Rhizophagus irregularis]